MDYSIQTSARPYNCRGSVVPKYIDRSIDLVKIILLSYPAMPLVLKYATCEILRGVGEPPVHTRITQV
jgi:hypothetical protein